MRETALPAPPLAYTPLPSALALAPTLTPVALIQLGAANPARGGRHVAKGAGVWGRHRRKGAMG